MIQRILRISLIILFAGSGMGLSYYYLPGKIAGFVIQTDATRYGVIGIIAAVSGFIGVILAPGIVRKIIRLTS